MCAVSLSEAKFSITIFDGCRQVMKICIVDVIRSSRFPIAITKGGSKFSEGESLVYGVLSDVNMIDEISDLEGGGISGVIWIWSRSCRYND